MSLINRFLGKTLCVGLAPGRFTSAMRHGSAYDAASAFTQEISNPGGHWQPLLNLLQSTVQQQAGLGHRFSLSVVLSGWWCRMMMVPWSDALLKESSAQRFLQSRYVALYGDAARDWTIAADDADYGQPRLTCGVESELLHSLKQLAADNKVRCKSIEPVISAAWRAVVMSAGQNSRAFAVVEEDRLTLACAAQGRITVIQSQPCGNDWLGELVYAWQRWTLRMPECSDIGQVMVLILAGAGLDRDLPAPFKRVLLPSHGLAPVYEFLTCGGRR